MVSRHIWNETVIQCNSKMYTTIDINCGGVWILQERPTEGMWWEGYWEHFEYGVPHDTWWWNYEPLKYIRK